MSAGCIAACFASPQDVAPVGEVEEALHKSLRFVFIDPGRYFAACLLMVEDRPSFENRAPHGDPAA